MKAKLHSKPIENGRGDDYIYAHKYRGQWNPMKTSKEKSWLRKFKYLTLFLGILLLKLKIREFLLETCRKIKRVRLFIFIFYKGGYVVSNSHIIKSCALIYKCGYL